MSTMPPRYITAMRSASATTSSSSVDTTMTGIPASRACTIRLCTNSIEPTSSPRVGCAATSSRKSRLSSRASTTFCWLPPDNRPTSVSVPCARMSNSVIFSSANCSRSLNWSDPARTNGAPEDRFSIRFSLIVNSATKPSSVRSSGTKPTPESSTERTLLPISSRPSSVMDPLARACSPRIASVSSVWPFPCTPAIARISPAWTSKSTWLTTY